MRRVLTIAGSDSGGGAGIQADVRTISALGAHPLTAVTALTAQNTVGVQGIHEAPPEFVEAQLEAVLSDIGCDAAKTGMLASSEIIRVVAACVRRHSVEPLVVDPVMVATSGDRLLSEDAREVLVSELLPLATVITPNIPELEALTEMRINDPEDILTAASLLRALGPEYVLVKGGHLNGAAIDVLFDGDDLHTFEAERIGSGTPHGSGCVFSAAIATYLAQGCPVDESVRLAKEFVTTAIRAAEPIGAGPAPTNPHGWIAEHLETPEILEALDAAAAELIEARLGALVPEVRSNLGYARARAATVWDVAAFPGRITESGDEVLIPAGPEFGASSHIARVILTAMRHDPSLRSAMNIRYSPKAVAACRRVGLRVGGFRREDEPAEVREREGSSLEWGTDMALREAGGALDVIYDEGGIGKEPMIRILGESPAEVVARVLRIAEAIS